MLFLIIFFLQNCLTDSQKKPKNNNTNGEKGINESFRKTGWITATKYRAVIFIMTADECKNSSLSEIEERIRLEAYKNLQKELSPSYNRNAVNQIKYLADNYGKMMTSDKECVDGNIYYYDLDKPDLRLDFERVKNLK
jgi:hypothetical protein